MKALCILGRLHPAHTGLFAGRTYDIAPVAPCAACGQSIGVHAEGSVFLRPKRLACIRCGTPRVFTAPPWGRRRFIEADPKALGVTEKEVRELYAPSKIKVRRWPQPKETT